MESPGTLFANELVTDVGGTCWGSNEPLAIIDHRFSRDGQFPSASAAVLHKTRLIRDRFVQWDGDLLWLVTHKQPDFDAVCSMYLARRIIEAPDAAADWEGYGLHPDGWFDLPDRLIKKIDWFNPDLGRVPVEHRWPLLLASYASVLDQRRRVSCPRQRALNSILSAALKRGRDYLDESSGATEFFYEVRTSLSQGSLNPVFDSVLEGSPTFAPELAMLGREAEAYERDVRRARKSIVYLPQSEAPSPKFFKTPKEVALLQVQGKAQEVNAEQLLLADTFRTPTDGIYLRDPESLLFQEWARLDLENSSLGAGFEFTAIAFSDGRPAGVVNRTDYVFSIDPERANGRHLYTVWSRLQTQEVEALRAQDQGQAATPEDLLSARGLEQGAAAVGTLLSDPWFGGQNSFGTVVRSPNRGTAIGPPGVRDDLRDDPVVEEVRTELEGPIYSAESLVAGPHVTVVDFAGAKNHLNNASHQFDLNAPLQIPPPRRNYLRFATIDLRSDVPILPEGNARRGLAQQIGETLWQVLYPEMLGSTPSDFTERHLIVAPNQVSVWGDRGIAVAQKHSCGSNAASPNAPEPAPLRDDFAGIVSLARDIDQFATGAELFSRDCATAAVVSRTSARNGATSLEVIVARGEELARRAVEVEHNLTLPDRDLLRRFSDAIGIDQLLATLHDLNHSAAENLRRQELAVQASRMGKRADIIAKIQSKLEWLEVFIVGFLAIAIIDLITRYVDLGNRVEDALVLLGGPALLGFTALILKPWKRKATGAEGAIHLPGWVMIAVIVAWVGAWLAGVVQIWAQ